MSFEIDGMNELLKQFDQLQNISDDMQKEALKAGANTLQDEFKSNIYKRIDRETGTAQESITVSRITRKKEIHIGPTGDAFYLNFLENGFFNVRAGKFIPATPIFGPIFVQSRQKVLSAMVDAAEEELKRL